MGGDGSGNVGVFVHDACGVFREKSDAFGDGSGLRQGRAETGYGAELVFDHDVFAGADSGDSGFFAALRRVKFRGLAERRVCGVGGFGYRDLGWVAAMRAGGFVAVQ